MAIGHVSLLCQELKLGEFATPNYDGISVYSTVDRIHDAQYPIGFHIEAPDGKSCTLEPCGVWDLKHVLMKSVEEVRDMKWDFQRLELEESKKKRSSTISSNPRAGKRPRNLTFHAPEA